MDPTAWLEPVTAFLATISLGAMVLIGMKMRYRAKIKMREQTEAGRHLREAFEETRDEVRLLREEVLDVQERLDFTERLLTQALPRAAEPERNPTPV